MCQSALGSLRARNLVRRLHMGQIRCTQHISLLRPILCEKLRKMLKMIAKIARETVNVIGLDAVEFHP